MIRSSSVWELESQPGHPPQRAFCPSPPDSGPLSGHKLDHLVRDQQQITRNFQIKRSGLVEIEDKLVFRRLLDRVCADVHDVRETAHAQEARQIIIARDARPRQWQICNEPRKYYSRLPHGWGLPSDRQALP